MRRASRALASAQKRRQPVSAVASGVVMADEVPVSVSCSAVAVGCGFASFDAVASARDEFGAVWSSRAATVADDSVLAVPSVFDAEEDSAGGAAAAGSLSHGRRRWAIRSVCVRRMRLGGGGRVADVVAEPLSEVAGEVEDAAGGAVCEVAGASDVEAAPPSFCGAAAVCCPLASSGAVAGPPGSVAAGGVVSPVAELPDAAVAPLPDAVEGSSEEAAPPFSARPQRSSSRDSTGFASGVLASAVAGGVADAVAEAPSVVAGEVEDAVAERSEVAERFGGGASASVFCGCCQPSRCPLASSGRGWARVEIGCRRAAAACAAAEPPSEVARRAKVLRPSCLEVAVASEVEAAPPSFCGAAAVCCPAASSGLVGGALRSVCRRQRLRCRGVTRRGAAGAAAVASALPPPLVPPGGWGQTRQPADLPEMFGFRRGGARRRSGDGILVGAGGGGRSGRTLPGLADRWTEPRQALLPSLFPCDFGASVFVDGVSEVDAGGEAAADSAAAFGPAADCAAGSPGSACGSEAPLWPSAGAAGADGAAVEVAATGGVSAITSGRGGGRSAASLPGCAARFPRRRLLLFRRLRGRASLCRSRLLLAGSGGVLPFPPVVATAIVGVLPPEFFAVAGTSASADLAGRPGRRLGRSRLRRRSATSGRAAWSAR